MRYFFLLLIAYYVFKSVGKMLSNLKIVDDDVNPVKGQNIDTHNHLRVDEADIEDADFKEIEE